MPAQIAVAALSPRAFGLGPLPAAVVSGPPEPEVRGFVPGTPIPTSGIPGPKSRDSGPKKSGFRARAPGSSEAQDRKSDSLAPGFRLDPDDPARAFRSGPSRTPAGHDRELGRRGWGGVTLSVHIGLTHGSPFK